MQMYIYWKIGYLVRKTLEKFHSLKIWFNGYTYKKKYNKQMYILGEYYQEKQKVQMAIHPISHYNDFLEFVWCFWIVSLTFFNDRVLGLTTNSQTCNRMRL